MYNNWIRLCSHRVDAFDRRGEYLYVMEAVYGFSRRGVETTMFGFTILYWFIPECHLFTSSFVPLVGRGSAAERDGGNRPGIWGHARTELPPSSAAEREGRCQLQTDDRTNQVEPIAQVGARGEGHATRTGKDMLWEWHAMTQTCI